MSNDLSINIHAKDQTASGLASVETSLKGAEAGSDRLINKIVGLKRNLDDVGASRGLDDVAAKTRGAVDSIGDLVFKANDAKRAIDGAGQASGIQKIARDAIEAQQQIDRIGSSVRSSVGGNSALLQNMGRVISDMPYGIMGVANNVEQLASSWRAATVEAGGSRAAISGVLAGLAGPSGLLMVGVPVVTALAVAFGDDLIRAINAGGESVDQLKQKLEGIQQYRDFDMTIRIAGLSGLAKLRAELDALIAKKAYLEGRQRVDSAVAKSEPPGIVQAFANPLMYGLTYDNYRKKNNSAKAAQRAFDIETARKIEKSRGLDLGEEENIRYLKMIGYSEAAARNRLASRNAGVDIAVKQMEIDSFEGPKASKGGGGGGSSVAAKAQREAEAVDRAVGIAMDSLGKMSKESLPNVEEATSAVNKAAEELRKAVDSRDKTAITERTEAFNREFARYEKATAAWESAVARYGRQMVKVEDATLSVSQAQDELAKANEKAKEAFEAKDTDALTAALDEQQQAQIRLKKATDEARKKLQQMEEAFGTISGFAEKLGLTGLGDVLGEFYKARDESYMDDLADDYYGGNKQRAQAHQYMAIADSIGSMIGGQVGGALSGAASGAIAGLQIGGPVGAVVGGVVGLASSLFGGDSNEEQERANRDNMRRQIYDAMVSSALSGGTESLKLLRATGYDYDVLKNYADPGYPGMKSGTSGRLFEDRGEAELQTLQEVISVLDQAGQTMSQFVRPTMLRDLDAAATLLEYSVAQVGDLAELTAAYQAQQIMTITGLNADVIGSFISDAVAADVTGAAGKAFSEKFEESVAESIRQMAISNLVTNSIMPVLQPALTALVSGLTSGDLTADEMAALYDAVTEAAAGVSPLVTSLAQAFETAGIGATSSGSASANKTPGAYATYAEYALAAAGYRGYAEGGVHYGGWRVVGEREAELEYTAPSRIISGSESRAMLDNRGVVAELKTLRGEQASALYAIAKNTAKTAEIIDKWERDGMPEVAT